MDAAATHTHTHIQSPLIIVILWGVVHRWTVKGGL
jgi:hypothetical protein